MIKALFIYSCTALLVLSTPGAAPFAFTHVPWPGSVTAVTTTKRGQGISSFSSSPFPLRYRAIDELDDEADPLMVTVRSRAPKTDWFGWGVKKMAAVGSRDAKDDATSAGKEPPSRREPKRRTTSMNVGLIRSLLLNQLTILILGTAAALSKLAASSDGGFDYVLNNLDSMLNWADVGATSSATMPGTFLDSMGLGGIFSGSHASIWDFSLDPDRILLGIGGALPLLAVSHRIEKSDRRAFANVNFSTIVMTMTLFGRRKEPPSDFIPENYPIRPFPTTPAWDVVVQSLYLSVVTALCEETVFRRCIPAVIVSYTGSTAVALLGQAALFGLGHANRKSPRNENSIVVGLQFLNGLGNGLLYLLSGGDLLPCVVSHALYDFVTFYGTWMSSNGQLEYAEQMYCEPLDPDLEDQVRELLAQSGLLSGKGKLDPRMYRTLKRLFYVFDFDQNKALSLSEVRKGVAYMALERHGVPPPQEQIDALFRAAVEARQELSSTTVMLGGEGVPKATQQSRGEDRLTFVDFLRLFLTMMGRSPSSKILAAS